MWNADLRQWITYLEGIVIYDMVIVAYGCMNSATMMTLEPQFMT